MPSDPLPLLAAIEAGGTKFVCAVAHDPSTPLREERFPTTSPEETLDLCIAFFQQATHDFGRIHAMGIGTFGPANINPRSPSYGCILTTPKLGWEGFHMIQHLRTGLGQPLPIAFETDVNAAAIGESSYGAAAHCLHVAYVTVGTGIGGGYLHRGIPLHGRMHPEIGHLIVPDLDSAFGTDTCICPFHSSCLEGRASGPAIEARWGSPSAELPADHPAWQLEAQYLAHAALDLTAAWSPDLILIGGGVLQQEGLIAAIREQFFKLANGYWSLPPLEDYLRLPALGQRAGIVGALSLAARLVDEQPHRA